MELIGKAMSTGSLTMADALVTEKLADIAFYEEVKNLFVGVITLALAIPTGGASVAAAAAVGGFAPSAYQAMKSIQKYQLESALAGSDLNKRAYALAAEDPSMLWVALDVVFCVIDGAARAIAREADDQRCPLARTRARRRDHLTLICTLVSRHRTGLSRHRVTPMA